MSFLKSLGESPHLYDVFKTRPRMSVLLFLMLDEIMVADGPFDQKERELIAAYVSGLNSCSFCYRGHKAIAELFGVEENLIDKMVEDLDSVELDAKLVPVMRYVKKLTLTPSKMMQRDADAVYAQGYGEDALINIVEVTAAFAMFNRIADGAGISAENTKTTLTSKSLGTYIDNLVRFGVQVPVDLKAIL